MGRDAPLPSSYERTIGQSRDRGCGRCFSDDPDDRGASDVFAESLHESPVPHSSPILETARHLFEDSVKSSGSNGLYRGLVADDTMTYMDNEYRYARKEGTKTVKCPRCGLDVECAIKCTNCGGSYTPVERRITKYDSYDTSDDGEPSYFWDCGPLDYSEFDNVCPTCRLSNCKCVPCPKCGCDCGGLVEWPVEYIKLCTAEFERAKGIYG